MTVDSCQKVTLVASSLGGLAFLTVATHSSIVTYKPHLCSLAALSDSLSCCILLTYPFGFFSVLCCLFFFFLTFPSTFSAPFLSYLWPFSLVYCWCLVVLWVLSLVCSQVRNIKNIIRRRMRLRSNLTWYLMLTSCFDCPDSWADLLC